MESTLIAFACFGFIMALLATLTIKNNIKRLDAIETQLKELTDPPPTEDE